MSGNVNQRPNVLNLAERTTALSAPAKKIIRAPMPKKRSKGVPLSERVTLERVLGLTVRDNRAFACDPTTGLVVYPAGCVIVLLNPKRNKQSHIFNHSRKTITALAISSDGKNIVSGECGHKPAVRVWDTEERCQLAEYHGHKFGINCVAFSPNLKYVVSVGEHHDMVVNVWKLKDGSKHAAGKISLKVAGLSFSEDGSRFVTAGNRSIKFWYMSSKAKTRETLPLSSRSGILGEQRNNFFCSVACGLSANQSKTYAVTKSGLLCQFNEQRLLDKWVELRTTSAYCIVPSEEYLFVGCADGIVRLFNASSLNFVATLPRPHSLGVNVADGIDPSHMITHRENATYPAAIAITYDDIAKKITCVYNDHSMYVWDVHDVKKVGKQRSFLYHSSCIWGAEVYPSLANSGKEALPPGSFLTYASDDTIRIWNVDPAMNTDTFRRNIYSNELLKVIYVDEQLEHLCNAGSAADKVDNAEGKNGIRCISISADGQLLASGDRSGNVRIHDMQFMDQVQKIEAHDSEVLCLEFSRPESGYYLLTSASRDRLIHVFNMEEDCSLMQTLDDHSSSITAVKFTQSNGRLQMISCGADKALMFRVITQNPHFEFIRNHHVVGKTTMYDLTVDPTEKYVAVACQDRNIRIHNAVTGKLKRTYKGSLGEDGTLIRVELDPSGMYIATSCSDKSVAIFDFYSGECVATMDGHSELVTGIKFTNDCKHLISTSGDGCIFVWKLPWGFTHNMKERLNEMGQHMKEAPTYPQLRRGTYVVPPEVNLDPKVTPIETRNMNYARVAGLNSGSGTVAMDTGIIEEQEDEVDGDDDADWQPSPKLHNAADLPLWAKKQVCGEELPSPTTYSNPAQPRGCWAQRLDSKGFKVKSEWDAHRDIELKLQDGIDRRRYTVEPENLAEQAAVAETERLQTSLHISEPEDFVPAEEGLAGLEANVANPRLQGFVSCSRGSDPFLPPTSHPSDALSPDTPDDDELNLSKEEEEEEEEEEAADVIIYPPSEESSSSPETLKFQVTESTSSLEELQRRRARSINKKESPRSSKVIEDDDPMKVVGGAESTDPVSLGTSEDEDEEEGDDEAEEDTEEAEGDDEAEEDAEEAVNEERPSTEDDPFSSTPSSSGNVTASAPAEEADGRTSLGPGIDDESFLHTNYGFTEQEKFGKCLEQLQSGFASVGLNGGSHPHHHRLSISSKFLSRSQLSHIRGVVEGAHTMPPSTVGGVTAQVYLQRRKEVMAKAVDETRRRLQSMGWNSLRGKPSTTASSSASSTTTTTPVSTPTSSQKSAETTPTSLSQEECSKKDPPPDDAEQFGGGEKPSDTDGATPESTRDNVSSAAQDKATNNHATQIVEGDRKSKPDSQSVDDKTQLVDALANKQEKDSAVAKKSGNNNENSAARDGSTMTDRKEAAAETEKVASHNEHDTVKVNPETKTKTESEARSSIPAEVSKAATAPESVLSSDDASHMTDSQENTHKPIIKGKRPVSAPDEVALEDVEKANKENLERSSRYDPHHGRRPISSSSKNKMEKMKARKEQPPTMRKSTSMSDLSQAKLNEESRSDSPSFMMVLTSHPRSHSVERKKMRANSPAREKHRARPERILPLVPGLPKPKSYEVGTTSSRAKVSSRKDETPPSSPSRTSRGKRPSWGASSEGFKQSKSGGSSPEIPSEPLKDATAADQPSAKDALADKAKQHTEPATASQERMTKEQAVNFKDSRRSSSPSILNLGAPLRDLALGGNRDQADKRAMPPPASSSVAKSNRSLRRSSATRAELRQQRRRASSSKILPHTNDASTTEVQKGSSDSQSTSETSQTDAKPSSPRSRSSSYRETRSSSLRESLSPKPSRKTTAPSGKNEPKEELQTDPGRASSKLKNANGDQSENPVPKRRRPETIEHSESNISNNNSTDTQSQDSKYNLGDQSLSSGPTSHRRRSSEKSDPVESHLCGRTEESGTKTSKKEQEGAASAQSEMPALSVPEVETSMLTFDMMKTQVDNMKTAFDQCLELCVKAQEGESHQNLLDYFTSTFSQMQAASSTTLASRQSRRHLNHSVTDDTLSDVSETSLPFDDLLRSSSSGIVTGRPSGLTSSDVEALRSSLTSCRKTPPNGMTGDVETTSALALLDQYSTILVSLVRQKVEDQVSEGSAATQTQHSLDSAV